jgi:hypothetical protein
VELENFVKALPPFVNGESTQVESMWQVLLAVVAKDVYKSCTSYLPNFTFNRFP